MDDFNSETDSDYTSYWRDWVGTSLSQNIHNSDRTAQLLLGVTMGIAEMPGDGKHLFAWYVARTATCRTYLMQWQRDWVSKGYIASYLCPESHFPGLPPPYITLKSSPSGIRLAEDWPHHAATLSQTVDSGRLYLRTKANNGPVHIVTRQRILLRNRRGVPHGPIQPHRPQHRSPVLPICARPRNRRLRFRLRR